MARQGDREQRERYRELLEELRTLIPGAQVLFAFLLTAPFGARFSDIDRLGKIAFTMSLMGVAGATILFLAPAAYHRLADRRDRRGRLRYGVRTALAGMFLLAFSISCAIFVVIRFVFDSTAAGVALAAGSATLALAMWCVFPIRRRRRSGEASETQSP